MTANGKPKPRQVRQVRISNMGPTPYRSDMERIAAEQILYCLLCAQEAKKAIAAGVTDEEVTLNPALTWAIGMVGAGMPAAYPVCMSHLDSEEAGNKSRLLVPGS